MDKVNITVVGAGVVGLSIAAKLSKVYQDIFVLEKHGSFGQETSSRNSEVIHAGIYYPKDSLKAKTCIEGKDLLYKFCAENNIPHRKVGKLIVAINRQETKDLENLFKSALENGVNDLRLLSSEEIRRLERNILAEAAIYSPSTGILDTHAFMKTLASQFESREGTIAYDTELTGIEKNKEGFIVTVKDKREENFRFLSRVLINAAGLNSDKVSAIAGLSKEEYRLKYCKGDYCRLCSPKAKLVKRLIYPVPRKEGAGLGIHVTPDMAGIRPKLQGPGEGFRDFIIRDESVNGLPGFINLVGIESPGLTSSLAIAEIVSKFITN